MDKNGGKKVYSKEQRKEAVDLYIRYDLHASAVTRELGYPDRKSLYSWYEDRLEEEKTGIPFQPKLTKYSQVQKMDAVDYYLGHGKSLKGTIRKMGYPSHEILVSWIDELAPGARKIRRTGIALPYRKQAEMVGDLCEREGTAQTVADEHEVSRSHLYVLKRRMLPAQKEESEMKDQTPKDTKDVAALAEEIGELELKKHRLELNVAILEGTQALLKKAVGIAPDMLPNGKKIILVDALRNEFPLQEILSALALCRSTYYYQRKARTRDKYAKLRIRIRAISTSNYGCYGYRRTHAILASEGILVSEKVVRRIMAEEHIARPVRRKQRYNSYMGEISPGVENLIKRDFHAGRPNEKWLTDITEFSIPAGKVYLSPIIDCFDGMVNGWAMGVSPDAGLVNGMLDCATGCLKAGEHPIIHSDRGCHYRWPGWIQRMNEAGLVRSMSKKGCSPDNSACEGFFGRLKNEMFYGRDWKGVSRERFMDILEGYLVWYNNSRIKVSLGNRSPMAYRKSLGIVI